MPASPPSPPLPPLPPDFRISGITREQWSAWRRHPVTLVFRQYLAELAKDRLETGTQAMLTMRLTPEDQVRVACEYALLSEMADPKFDVVGLFYEKARMTQEEWDAEVARRAEAAEAGESEEETGVQVNDPDAEAEEDDDEPGDQSRAGYP